MCRDGEPTTTPLRSNEARTTRACRGEARKHSESQWESIENLGAARARDTEQAVPLRSYRHRSREKAQSAPATGSVGSTGFMSSPQRTREELLERDQESACDEVVQQERERRDMAHLKRVRVKGRWRV